MAHHYTIARPYAKAAFSDAEAGGKLEDWAAFLNNAGMVARDAKVQNLLNSPTVSALWMVDFFSDIVGVNDMDMKEFLVILSKNKRLSLLPDIAELFAEMMAEKAGVVTVEVISSDHLDEDNRLKLQKCAEKRFSAKVEMKYSLDKSLIGGAIIRSGNWVMDGSVKGKLARMRESLG